MRAIYLIVNTQNDKFYVGSTKDFDKRKSRHLRTLRNGTHHNIHLQRAFIKYTESAFDISIFKAVETDEDLLLLEAQVIEELEPEYNIGSVGGGDNLTNNPNRLAIIEKMTKSVNARYANMSPEEKREKYGQPGSLNPNWKGGIKYYCVCGTKINSTAKTCIKCTPREGKNNPFYGRKHTEETKLKLSLANKGSLPVNAREVFAEGEIFQSLAEAARAYDMTNGAMHYRVHHTSARWAEFFYTDTVDL
jgi:group I intron endonuclease